MRRKWMLVVPLAIAGMVVFAAIGGSIVQLLWNWLAPSLFGLRSVTFWQALGLLALCRILFGGFGLHGRSRYDSRRRIAERMETMTPEERERFRGSFRDRWGLGPPPGEREGH